jgi:murein DD-endopeptidase MepM/ murein hydrolase activator NlpD
VAVLLLLLLFIPAPVRNHLLSAIRPSAPVKTAVRETRPPFMALRYKYLSSPFGRRWGRAHEGVDLAAPGGAPIYAASAGTVIDSGWVGGYGRTVLIEHRPGFRTRYAHCARLLVKPGERVSQGRLIARVGSTGHSTGPHLHFEVIVNGQPRDPARYYRLERTPSTVSAVTSTVRPLPEDWLRSIADLMNLWHIS